jgi:hypothetical protein
MSVTKYRERNRMSRESFRPTGKEIKKALIDLDLSYMQLSQAVGCSVYYIREIAADTRKAVAMRKTIANSLVAEYRRNGYPLPGWAKTIKKEQSA